MMLAALLEEPPLTPPSDLGPHRRAEYLALPDEPRHELIYGRLYVSPSPLLLHQVVVAELWRVLDAVARRTGGLAVVAPMDVTLADHSIVQPDVIYVAPERRHVLGERIEGPPSLVVEVLAPGTARRDRGEKLRLYAEAGVDEYWIVDPGERQIEHLVLRDGEFVVTLPRHAVYRSPRLSKIELDVESFWRDLTGRLPDGPRPA